MKNTIAGIAIAAALTAGTAGVAAAQQQGKPIPEETPGLAKQATVAPDAARRAALARVPGATIQGEELEREHGHLLYSFDLKVPGKSGIEEVQIDAKTGAFLGREHEGPAAEAAEKRSEAGERGEARGEQNENGEQGEAREEQGENEGAGQAALAARARVSRAAARATVLARYRGAQVKSEELEEEGGMLIYSFDLNVRGKAGMEEVWVDAKTGKIVKTEHENAAAEKREQAHEGHGKP